MTMIMTWLATSYRLMAGEANQAKIVHCWETSGLLRAWERKYQVEAVARESELFRGVARDRRGLDDDQGDSFDASESRPSGRDDCIPSFLHVHVEDDTEADVHGWDDMDADLM